MIKRFERTIRSGGVGAWRRRIAGLGAVCFFFIFALSLPAQNRLNLFIWSEYIDPQIVADFEKEFDCKVTIDLYEDEASLMAKLQGGGVALYDVIVPPDHAVPALIHLKMVAPLRHEKIPNLRNVEAKFRNPAYDPGNKFTVPYQWGTVGLYVRESADQPVPETWGVIFDPENQVGPFLLIDSDRDMIGAALRYLGYSLNSTDRRHLREARDLLLKTKKRSLGFAGGVGGRNRVLSREAAAAVVYSGDAVRGMQEAPGTRYFVPREGSQLWVDNLAIPAQAPHRDRAEKFLNFILDAKVGARLAGFNQFATPNGAAKAFIPKKDLSDPAIYPPAETMTKLELLRNLGAENRLYDEIWTQIKSR